MLYSFCFFSVYFLRRLWDIINVKFRLTTGATDLSSKLSLKNTTNKADRRKDYYIDNWYEDSKDESEISESHLISAFIDLVSNKQELGYVSILN